MGSLDPRGGVTLSPSRRPLGQPPPSRPSMGACSPWGVWLPWGGHLRDGAPWPAAPDLLQMECIPSATGGQG